MIGEATTEIPTDELPRDFGSAIGALRWAYQRLVSSQHYARPRIPEQPKSSWDRTSGPRIDPHDMDDIARTITATVGLLSPGSAVMLRAMFGDDETRGAWLNHALTELMHHSSLDGLYPGTQRAMAHIALDRAVSALDVTSRGGSKIRPPKKTYAKVLNVAPQSLADPPYREMVNGLEDAAVAYRDQALHELRTQLESVGIVV